MSMFKIDGIRMRLANADVDNDGATNEVEDVRSHKDFRQIDIKDTTELGEALDHQNRDIEDENKLSSVDFISRINEYQHAPLVAVDTIAAMGVISSQARIVVKNIMRKAVSLGGKGREEFVQVVTGKKENDIKKSQMVVGNPNQK